VVSVPPMWPLRSVPPARCCHASKPLQYPLVSDLTTTRPFHNNTVLDNIALNNIVLNNLALNNLVRNNTATPSTRTTHR